MLVEWGASAHLGRRPQQQDRFVVARVDGCEGSARNTAPRVCARLFAVFDGHGHQGARIAELARDAVSRWFATSTSLHNALLAEDLRRDQLPNTIPVDDPDTDIDVHLSQQMHATDIRSRRPSATAIPMHPTASSTSTTTTTTIPETPVADVSPELVRLIRDQFLAVQQGIRDAAAFPAALSPTIATTVAGHASHTTSPHSTPLSTFSAPSPTTLAYDSSFVRVLCTDDTGAFTSAIAHGAPTTADNTIAVASTEQDQGNETSPAILAARQLFPASALPASPSMQSIGATTTTNPQSVSHTVNKGISTSPRGTTTVSPQQQTLTSTQQDADLDPYFSGTTATMVIYLPRSNKMIIITLGDSKCLVVADCYDYPSSESTNVNEKRGSSNLSDGKEQQHSKHEECTVCHDNRDFSQMKVLGIDTGMLPCDCDIKSTEEHYGAHGNTITTSNISKQSKENCHVIGTKNCDTELITASFGCIAKDTTGRRAVYRPSALDSTTKGSGTLKPIKNIKNYYAESLDVPEELLNVNNETATKLSDNVIRSLYECHAASRDLRYLRFVTPNMDPNVSSTWCDPLKLNETLVVFRTKDHSCSHPEETKRIRESGGRVDRLMDDKGIEYGPLRVFKGTLPYPGLAVTRVLGDTSSAHTGVLNVPDITVINLSDFPRLRKVAVLMASDGLWDGLTVGKSVEALTRTVFKREPIDSSSQSLVVNHEKLLPILEERRALQFAPSQLSYLENKPIFCPYCCNRIGGSQYVPGKGKRGAEFGSDEELITKDSEVSQATWLSEQTPTNREATPNLEKSDHEVHRQRHEEGSTDMEVDVMPVRSSRKYSFCEMHGAADAIIARTAATVAESTVIPSVFASTESGPTVTLDAVMNDNKVSTTVTKSKVTTSTSKTALQVVTADWAQCNGVGQLSRSKKVDEISQWLTEEAVTSMDEMNLDDNVTNILITFTPTV